MTTTTTYAVTGMTCGHCVSAVTEELTALAGVTEVRVELATDGPSQVHVASDAPLTAVQVREAIEEAGYALDEAGS